MVLVDGVAQWQLTQAANDLVDDGFVDPNGDVLELSQGDPLVALEVNCPPPHPPHPLTLLRTTLQAQLNQFQTEPNKTNNKQTKLSTK